MKNNTNILSHGVKHIIMIGFKHSGKSAIGRRLADKIGREFYDLDSFTEALYTSRTGDKLESREIMQKEGEEYFRELEDAALKVLIAKEESSVIAVGGGTPMQIKNRELLKAHTVVYVSAPAGILYERIMVNGRPAFFPKDLSSFRGFQKILSERLPVFESLANVTVDNNATVDDSAERIESALRAVESHV